MISSRGISVQLIKIHWDKTHRGSQQGAIRKALPRLLPFAPPPKSSQNLWQSVTFDARSGYKRNTAWHSKPKVPGADWRNPYPVSAKQEGDFLRLGLGRDLYLGKMQKKIAGRTLARLPFGKRVAIHFNDVHDGNHQRWYFDYSLNVGFAQTPTLDLPLFREVDLRRLLY